eukprot:COSAG02_NODE_1189_length_13995_cov_7.850101_7_plen_57_part_00
MMDRCGLRWLCTSCLNRENFHQVYSVTGVPEGGEADWQAIDYTPTFCSFACCATVI